MSMENRSVATEQQLQVGARVRSYAGEMSLVGEEEVETGPNALGVVTEVNGSLYECYSVSFECGVAVLLTHAEVTNPTLYEVLP